MNYEVVRAFIAAELPPRVMDHLEQIQNRLKGQVKGVRWVKKESIHLTLAFLGDVEVGRTGAIADVIARQAAERSRVTFSLGSPGAFPSFRRPRVIWVGLDGDVEGLARIQNGLASDLEGLGFARERKAFIPHLTLGRVKSPREVDTGLEELIGHAGLPVESPSFEFDGLTLFRSELTPAGAVYTRLGHFPFGR